MIESVAADARENDEPDIVLIGRSSRETTLPTWNLPALCEASPAGPNEGFSSSLIAAPGLPAYKRPWRQMALFQESPRRVIAGQAVSQMQRTAMAQGHVPGNVLIGGHLMGGPPAAAQPDPLDQLKKLGELRDSGVLTEEEFTAQKAKLLNT